MASLGLSAVRRQVRVKAMGDMTGLVNHMKEATTEKESECQSARKEVKLLMPPLISVKL